MQNMFAKKTRENLRSFNDKIIQATEDAYEIVYDYESQLCFPSSYMIYGKDARVFNFERSSSQISNAELKFLSSQSYSKTFRNWLLHLWDVHWWSW